VLSGQNWKGLQIEQVPDGGLREGLQSQYSGVAGGSRAEKLTMWILWTEGPGDLHDPRPDHHRSRYSNSICV
jgi:hypothetical protein